MPDSPAASSSAQDDEDLDRDLIALERQVRREQPPSLLEAPATSVQEGGPVEGILSVLSAPAELRGLMLGPYELRQFRGAGTYGAVWRAIDHRSGREVALKIPHLNWRSDDDLARRYGDEVEALQKFRHTNVLSVLEVVRQPGLIGLAMEYCGGQSLDRWLAEHQGRVSPRAAAWIVRSLAEGVETCHQHGIVHGDIKPANVLLFEAAGTAEFPYEPRLTDFGLAVFATAPARSGGSSTLGGTLEYMAPELFQGGPGVRSIASDVYALGVLLHKLLTGHTPFGTGALGTVIARIVDDTPRPMSTPAVRVPEALERITRVCLSKSPRDRYPSAGDLARDLNAFLEGQAVAARIESAGRRWARRLRRQERVMEAGILIIAIETTLIGWMWLATAIALAGVEWLPPHMTIGQLVRDSVLMTLINLLPIAAAIGFMLRYRWCALAAALLCTASTLLSVGNLTGLIPPPFHGVYHNDRKLQVVIFSLLSALFAIQAAVAVGAWTILRPEEGLPGRGGLPGPEDSPRGGE